MLYSSFPAHESSEKVRCDGTWNLPEPRNAKHTHGTATEASLGVLMKVLRQMRR